MEIDSATARQLIASQFPGLRPVSIRPFAEGWDNTAFLVNERYIFRFPRRHIAVSLIQTEMHALPRLASRLPRSIPNPVFMGASSAAFPYPFAGYERLSGRSACAVNPTATERSALARPIAAFLAALHRLRPDELQLDLPGDELQRAQPKSMSALIRERWPQASIPATSEQQAVLAELLDVDRDFGRRGPCPVHGDLYVRHLLLDEQARLTGVIDWGDLHLGDPAVDLALAWSFLPRSAHATFRAAYGEIDAGAWRLARLRALVSGLALWLYGHDRRDEDLVRESRLIMDQVLGPG